MDSILLLVPDGLIVAFFRRSTRVTLKLSKLVGLFNIDRKTEIHKWNVLRFPLWHSRGVPLQLTEWPRMLFTECLLLSPKNRGTAC